MGHTFPAARGAIHTNSSKFLNFICILLPLAELACTGLNYGRYRYLFSFEQKNKFIHTYFSIYCILFYIVGAIICGLGKHTYHMGLLDVVLRFVFLTVI